ncbi:MAG: efflux RND transporter periplasmic adaptor subunit [Pseudohongiella sp.]|nr:efflux RND transporter periplasmic adaptor subunit [Pseudohongiella sp.]
MIKQFHSNPHGLSFRPCRIVLLVVVMLVAACSSESETGNTSQTGAAPAGPQGGMRGGPGGFGGGFGGQGGMPPGLIPAVEVVAAQYGGLPLEERLTGQVTARNQAEIFPEVGGPIVQIFADNGQFVNAGDPLVQIRDTEYRERLQQAESQLEVARAQTRQAEANFQVLANQLIRIEELRTRQLETVSALEAVRAQVAVAQADVQLRQAQQRQVESQLEERRMELARTTVRAPTSGTIGLRNAERGQIASQNTRLFLIGDLTQMQVEILLTERNLTYIRQGMPVNLYSDSWPDLMISADIARVSPFLDSSTLRTQAYIDVSNQDGLMRPGMFVTVDVLYGQSEEAVLIPNSAIYRHPRTGVEGIFVMQPPVGDEFRPQAEVDGAPALTPSLPVSFVPVDVIASGRMASGVRGIKAGDWVVTVGQNLLTGNTTEARARLVDWQRMMDLQRMQSRDLFEIIDAARREAQARTES